MKKEFKITSDEMYHKTMVDIYNLMNKGEQNLTEAEATRLGIMAVEAERYEDEVLGLVPVQPKTIPEMVELKMFEQKMTQAALAEKLNIGKPKLSQILNGKRPPDVAFLKAAYKVLNIDPAFLLEKAPV